MNTHPADFPPIQELIPHRGESILLDSITAHDRESTTARLVVGGRPWLRREDGSVGAWLAVEYMAQCIATHEGLLAREDGRVLPMGFLVSVTRLTLSRATFADGERLLVSARRTRGRPGLGVLSHRCTLVPESGGSETLAEGRLSIAVEPESREFRAASG